MLQVRNSCHSKCVFFGVDSARGEQAATLKEKESLLAKALEREEKLKALVA